MPSTGTDQRRVTTYGYRMQYNSARYNTGSRQNYKSKKYIGEGGRPARANSRLLWQRNAREREPASPAATLAVTALMIQTLFWIYTANAGPELAPPVSTARA